MKLVNFSVTNYRSITTAHKISLQDYTVLVGRNNEGKSNLLMALNVAMRAMIQHSSKGDTIRNNTPYKWERDFPIQLQDRKNGLESIFKLNFRLNHDENLAFMRETGIKSNEDIPIEIKIGRDNKAKIKVPKRGSSSFNNKSEQIASFICDRISFNYIGAVRTENMAVDRINSILNIELRKLDENPEYKSAMQTIKKLRMDVCNNLSEKILQPLQEFLPELQTVIIREDEDNIPFTMFYRNKIDVILDDGTPTNIQFKGDGIKSLVSLAILKESRAKTGASIIAIEEPESHLHPEAIHRLVGVINGISENHQVIITTHNPLFVQRNGVSNNIIVHAGTAKSAKSIKEIREILGVLPEDNLINASHVLVVEGEDDRIALSKILKSLSPTIKDALNKNTLVIQSLGGAGNLSSELSKLRAFACKYFVFLDNDNAGIEAADKAIAKGLLTEADIKYTICKGSPEAEFEDCLNSEWYVDIVKEAFSVDLNVAEFSCSKKWSERLRNVFYSQGQRWTDSIEQKVKEKIAEAIPEENADKVLNEHKRSSIDALVVALENMLMQR